jgi:hypothetical protein
VGEYHQLLSGGYVAATVSALCGVEGVKALIRAARSYPGVALLAGALAVIAITRYRNDGAASRHIAAVKSGGKAAMERVGELADVASDATALLESAAIVTTDSTSLRDQVAREVAVAPDLPTRRELATRFGTSMDEMARVLDEPMFVRTGRGRYRLGSSGSRPPLLSTTLKVS